MLTIRRFKDYAGDALLDICDRLSDLKRTVSEYVADQSILSTTVLHDAEKRQYLVNGISSGVAFITGFESIWAVLEQVSESPATSQAVCAFTVAATVATATWVASSQLFKKGLSLIDSRRSDITEHTLQRFGNDIVHQSGRLESSNLSATDSAHAQLAREYMADALSLQKVIQLTLPLTYEYGDARRPEISRNIVSASDDAIRSLDKAYSSAESIEDIKVRDAYLARVAYFTEEITHKVWHLPARISGDIIPKFLAKTRDYEYRNTDHAKKEIEDIVHDVDSLHDSIPSLVHKIQTYGDVESTSIWSPEVRVQYQDVVDRMAHIPLAVLQAKAMGFDADSHSDTACSLNRAISRMVNVCCDTVFHDAANSLAGYVGVPAVLHSVDCIGHSETARTSVVPVSRPKL